MAEILHVTPRDRWEPAAASGDYWGDTLATEGFLHCCTPGQLAGVVSRYFQGVPDLVVLRIDPGRLRPPLRWEHSPAVGDSFPHLYGPLNPDAVVGVLPLEAALADPDPTTTGRPAP